MIEKVLKGNSNYWMWLAFLTAFIGVGAICYLRQYNYGLDLTGMGVAGKAGVYA